MVQGAAETRLLPINNECNIECDSDHGFLKLPLNFIDFLISVLDSDWDVDLISAFIVKDFFGGSCLVLCTPLPSYFTFNTPFYRILPLGCTLLSLSIPGSA